MSDKSAGGVPRGVHWSFWLISLFALIWSAMGAMNFIWQMDASALSSYMPVERMIIDGRPLWATAGFAIGVFGGILGAILLLIKKRAAIVVLIVSLLGVAVATLHAFIVVGLTSLAGLMPPLSALIVAGFLVGYAKRIDSMGWFG